MQQKEHVKKSVWTHNDTVVRFYTQFKTCVSRRLRRVQRARLCRTESFPLPRRLIVTPVSALGQRPRLPGGGEHDELLLFFIRLFGYCRFSHTTRPTPSRGCRTAAAVAVAAAAIAITAVDASAVTSPPPHLHNLTTFVVAAYRRDLRSSVRVRAADCSPIVNSDRNGRKRAREIETHTRERRSLTFLFLLFFSYSVYRVVCRHFILRKTNVKKS